MNSIVFDTSALLAFLRDEPGADRVESMLDLAGRERCYIHATNAVELLYKVARESGFESARESLRKFVRLGVAISEDMHPAFQEQCMLLKTNYPALSLGDTMAIALAIRLHGIVVTADKAFSKADKIVNVEQIR